MTSRIQKGKKERNVMFHQTIWRHVSIFDVNVKIVEPKKRNSTSYASFNGVISPPPLEILFIVVLKNDDP